jgi:hypothetical protein
MLVRRSLVLVVAVSAIFLLGSWGLQARAQPAQDETGNKSGESGNLTLRVAGDEGVRISGVCSVGDEEHDISGRLPQSFEYTPNDRQLACEIRNQGVQEDAELKVVLKGENTRSVHWSEGGAEIVIRLIYEDGTVSSSMSSSSSQKMSGISNSSTSAKDDAGRRGDGWGSLADQILEKVDEKLEQALP